MATLADTIEAPEESGVLVRVGPGFTGTVAARGAYSRLEAETMSWTRGFLGRPGMEWESELELPVPAFVEAFERRLVDWIRAHPIPTTGRSGPRERQPDSRAPNGPAARTARWEARFVALALTALERWQTEPEALVLWDIDETLVGTGAGVRFLRPSSEAVLRYAERHFPTLRHGVLSSLAPAWIPAAVQYIGAVLGRAESSPWCEPDHRFSFRPALDRFEEVDWDSMRAAMRERGLPDCGGGGFARGWPFYVTEFSRVLSVWHLRRGGLNAKVIDNDLNACFDEANPAENQIGPEARAWLGTVLGDSVATGPHWWPHEVEEWILALIDGFSG
jgi:hypothetical protein